MSSGRRRKEFNNRRIAIFEPRGDISTNPTLLCLVDALCKSGASLDVFMPRDDRYLSLNGTANRYPYPRRFREIDWGLSTALGNIRELMQSSWLDRRFASGAYDVIIGVNSEGVVKGYEYAKRFNVPLVYLSFELFFRDELSNRADMLEKESEVRASQYADLILIQDELRGRLLAVENSLDEGKFVYLPVSPSAFPATPDSGYCRNRFGIGPEQIVVLHSGSFRQWTYAEELIANVAFWPDRFCLMIHTRYRPKKADKYVKAAFEARLPRVFISGEPLASSEYEGLVASADIGLVLYKKVDHLRYTGKNIENIGLSSGKFAYYLKNGLAVIASHQNYYEKLLLDYEFGESINRIEEMPSALERLERNLAHHRAEARRLFSEKLDFDIHWPNVSERLLEIIG